MALSCAAVPAPASAESAIRLYLNGQELTSEAPPYIVPRANVTMVPLRVVSEGLGASVNWSAKEQKAEISLSGSTIVLTMGNTYAVVNGTQVPLDASVQMKQGRTMIPLRFVGEQLGLAVDWDASARKITLVSPGSPSSGGSESGQPSSGGTGNVPAANPGTGAPSGQTQLRGAWVSTVYNLDWPSAASSSSSAKQKQEYTGLLDDLQRLGMNAVFVQVRPSGDALYPSALVPWSAYLTGTQGKSPDYDPLAFMIEETHKRGMQFHAWFNPFRAATTADVSKLDPLSVVRAHPDWTVNAGGKLYINPGIPAARQSIIDAISEVVSRYNIDGVHLDDYFYPSNTPFDDDGTYKLYSAGTLMAKGDWRRSNINVFVQTLDERIHALKPSVRFGISPFGVWRNKSVDPKAPIRKQALRLMTACMPM